VRELDRCLDHLPQLEARVLVLRAAVNQPHVRSRARVARIMDLPLRRVERIERRALRRLRRRERRTTCSNERPASAGGTTQLTVASATIGGDAGGAGTAPTSDAASRDAAGGRSSSGARSKRPSQGQSGAVKGESAENTPLPLPLRALVPSAPTGAGTVIPLALLGVLAASGLLLFLRHRRRAAKRSYYYYSS
jgi:hypothetical protein